jgi:hypothetical protein
VPIKVHADNPIMIAMPEDAPSADKVLEGIIALAFVRAVPTFERLGRRMAVDADSLSPAVAQLAAEDLIESWTDPRRGRVVVLSAYTASRMKMRLSDREPLRWVPDRWSPPRQRNQSPTWSVPASQLIGHDGGRFDINQVPDPNAKEAHVLAAAAEIDAIRAEARMVKKRPSSPDKLPRPSIVLGVRQFRGRGPDHDPGDCPGCSSWRAHIERERTAAEAEGRPYAPAVAICVACRWYTHDHLIPGHIHATVRSSQTRESRGRKRGQPREGLRGGVGA